MKKSILFISMLVFVFSCREKDKVDVIAPVIQSATIDGNDTTAFTFEAGSNFTLSVAVSDNMGLNQIQYNIHAAEDGHTHEGTGNPGGQERLTSGHWVRTQTDNISGLNHESTWEIPVPDSIAGNWHIEISLLDEVGLTSLHHVILLTITNDNLPMITANTTPAVNTDGNITMSEGTTLSVNGLAEDVDGLARLFVHLDDWAGVAADTTEIPIVGISTNMAFNNLDFNGAIAGKYRLVVEAYDSLGYKRKWDTRVFVSE